MLTFPTLTYENFYLRVPKAWLCQSKRVLFNSFDFISPKFVLQICYSRNHSQTQSMSLAPSRFSVPSCKPAPCAHSSIWHHLVCSCSGLSFPSLFASVLCDYPNGFWPYTFVILMKSWPNLQYSTSALLTLLMGFYAYGMCLPHVPSTPFYNVFVHCPLSHWIKMTHIWKSLIKFQRLEPQRLLPASNRKPLTSKVSFSVKMSHLRLSEQCCCLTTCIFKFLYCLLPNFISIMCFIKQ